MDTNSIHAEDKIHCPKCNSTQNTANKKGFSGGKAAAGVILTGGIGLLAGTIGSKNITITCLSCGKQFKPGEGTYKATQDKIESKLPDSVKYSPAQKSRLKLTLKILGSLIIIISLFFLSDRMYFLGTVFLLMGGFVVLTGLVNNKLQ